MNWTVIAAVNNEQVLQSSLLNSPEIGAAAEVILQRGFSSAAAAYNDGLEKAKTDVVVLAHQDVYLPEGWVAAVSNALDILARKDPEWGVLGVWGVKRGGQGVGDLYCAGLRQRLGNTFAEPVEVRSLDELMLIVRKSSGLRFDPGLAGFHLYGTDICLEALRRGMKCYAISAFCVHNTNGYTLLPWQFWKCYLYLRRKWKNEVPIFTSCTQITAWCWPAIEWNLRRGVGLLLGRHKPGKRVADPARLYRENLRQASGLSIAASR